MVNSGITEKAFIVCFFTIFVGIALGVGSMASQFGAPGFFTLVAYGMAILGIIACIGALGKSCTSRDPSSYISVAHKDGLLSFHADFESKDLLPYISVTPHYGAPYPRSQTAAESSSRRVIFQVPNRCPSCNANLSDESIDWVGPLKVQCPYCRGTVDVEERYL